MIGQRFGMFEVLSEGKVERRHDGKRSRIFRYWKVLCDCGNIKEVREQNLKSGNSTNCGCVRKSKVAKIGRELNKTHGLSKHKMYDTWIDMVNRCTNPNHWAYKHYGGRGITVVDDWLNNLAVFIEWAESQPNYGEKSVTLDRIDINGNYEPKNCRFADKSTQSLNRRSNKNNSSGHHGVSARSNGKWRARITKDYKIINLGTFENLEDAIEARQLAEVNILGYLSDSEPINNTVREHLADHTEGS